MTTPFSKYEILGRVVETVCHMPTDAPVLQLCNAISNSIWEYLQDPAIMERFTPIKLGKPAPEIIKDIPHSIFDTEHVDDIPAEIKPKKPTVTPAPLPEPPAPRKTPVVLQYGPDGLPIPQIIWREKPFNLEKCYLVRYSNPCSTSLGKCRKPCVQTELWLFDKKTDELTTVDVEFADLKTLQCSLDPYVAYACKHRKVPEYIDHEINDAMEDLAAAAKEIQSYRTKQDEKLEQKVATTVPKQPSGKTRLEYYVELYKAGFKVSQIAREMGINEQYVYNLKNQAKNKGLIK